MSEQPMKLSRLTPESAALLSAELPLAQWSRTARRSLESALELVSYDIAVYLVEWEGESRIEELLPGAAIGKSTVAAVEGPHVWASSGHICATVSRLIDFMDGRSHRHKVLVY